MKTVTFRPLRRIKKTGKLSVPSYTTWRGVRTADYGKFNLTILDEYERFPKDEFVYNHKGELLYFYNYDPAEVPVFPMSTDREIAKYNNSDYAFEMDNYNFHFCFMRGCDVEGVPCFSHYTADYVAQQYKDMDEWHPLTVNTVLTWFGYFLFQLKNANLKFGK